MSDTPKEHSFKNGCYIGHVLIMVDGPPTATGMKGPKQEAWMLYSCDLRDISAVMACYGHEADRTVLFNGSGEFATVACSAPEFIDHWMQVKHSFDRIPVSELGLRTIDVMSIYKTDARK